MKKLLKYSLFCAINLLLAITTSNKDLTLIFGILTGLFTGIIINELKSYLKTDNNQ